MGEYEANASQTNDPFRRTKNVTDHISKDYTSKNELNDNLHLRSHVEWAKTPPSENFVVSAETHPLNGIFEQASDETHGPLLVSSVINPPGYNYNEINERENPYTTQPAYNLSYKQRMNSLAESDNSSDQDSDPRIERVKCLQITGLVICGIVLAIIVIYFGSEPTDSLRNGGKYR